MSSCESESKGLGHSTMTVFCEVCVEIVAFMASLRDRVGEASVLILHEWIFP